MIIKSRSEKSTFHRRTSISDLRTTTLQSVLRGLLTQWDLLDRSAKEQDSSAAYALLVVVPGCEDRLVIDKEDEWTLFCAEHVSNDTTAGQAVEVRIVPRSSVFDLAKSPIVQHTSVAKEAKQPGPAPIAQSSASPAPRFAFHSVEPQAIKARSSVSNPFSPPKVEESRQVPLDSGSPVAAPQAAMSLDEIMARSRRQGEGLNQLFGQLQARSAGVPVERDVQPSVDINEQQPASEQDNLPHMTGQEETTPASVPSRGQSREAKSGDKGPACASEDATPAALAKRPGRTAEEIGNVNAYLDTAWQERLAQMGHGSGGSPYAKLRTAKPEVRAQDDPVDQLTADQDAFSAAESSSSLSTAICTPSAPMSASKSNSGITRSPLHALNEESSEDLAFVSTEDPSFPFLSAPPSHSATPTLEHSSAFRFDEQQPQLESDLGSSGQDGAGRRFSLRGSLFKRNRVQSSDGLRAFNSQQNSGRATPDGAMTPRSFNSSVFRRRPLSVRSLSDALLGTARQRAGQNGDESRPESTTATPPSARQVLLTSTQRPTRRRHAAIRSLSDMSFLPRSARGRSRASSVQSHVSEVHSTTSAVGQCNEANSTSPSQQVGERSTLATEHKSAQEGQHTAGRGPGQRPIETSRPTLLRASHSSPLTSTAVNLSSSGGITLHISSIVNVRNDSKGEKDDAYGQQDADAERTAVRTGVNLFDIMLPREIRLDCLRALVQLYEDDESGGQNLETSSRTRRGLRRSQAKLDGMRALVRLSRVSRSWRSLVCDGQLWTTFDASLAKGISNESLLRICHAAGPFIRSINFANMQNLSSSTFLSATTSINRRSPSDEQQAPPQSIPIVGGRARAASVMRLPLTICSLSAYNVSLPSLTHLNVQGCRSLSTKALHQALLRLPQLRHLNISNLPCVTNETCLIIGASSPYLLSLNINRCFEVNGEGFTSLLEAAQGCVAAKGRAVGSPSSSPSLANTAQELTVEVQDVALDLLELYAVGLREVDLHLMETMGRALRNLRVLDLSYSSNMSDEAIAAFVRHPGPRRLDNGSGPDRNPAQQIERQTSYSPRIARHTWQSLSSPSSLPPSGPFVALSARQAGGDVLLDETHYRRKHAHLKRLSLSSCRGLTDRCCVHLAHALPHLQALEMANIGGTLREDGVIKLLETTPLLTRLDVEGAVELGERFLQAITPPLAYVESLGIIEAPSTHASSLLAPLSIGRLSRRALRRGRTDPATALAEFEQHGARASEERPERVHVPSGLPTAWTQAVPTGAHLTHLAVSHLWRLEANSLLALVRQCPKLMHLEVDDTHANDAILREFVALARHRRVHGAYINLVDCRALSKSANSEVFANGHARPRAGQSGDEFGCFYYGSGSASGGSGSGEIATNASVAASVSSRQGPNSTATAAANGPEQTAVNECEDELVVVKTFWAWQAVDLRVRKRRKDEAKRAAAQAKATYRANGRAGSEPSKRLRKGRDSLAMALNLFSSGGISNDDDDVDDDEQDGRWSRFTSTLLGQGEEEDDPRACTIM